MDSRAAQSVRAYVEEALSRYRESGDVQDGREAVRRAWDAADACWATGDRESGARWEEIAEGILS
jgi:hypothetical protein